MFTMHRCTPLPLPVPLLLLLLTIFTSHCTAHLTMIFPAPRGVCNPNSPFKPGRSVLHPVPDSKIDPFAHYPAGDKSRAQGSGLRSQISSYRGRRWMPFEPMNPRFNWRASVCGDSFRGRFAGEHLRHGRYYGGGERCATYKKGSVIDISLSVFAHHNGFMELHVCDLAKCGGDMSQACFKKPGACKQLKRAPNRNCDSGFSKKCGPIDRRYPGRWYIPCEGAGRRQSKRLRFQSTRKFTTFGYRDGTIKYKLPKGFTCYQCGLHFFFTSANNCNPPGVIEYFTGRDRPRNWGNCRGEGGARGGYSRNSECGRRFPEEYLQCADIRITP